MGIPEPTFDMRSAGERIERLLDAAAAAGPLARERAEELLRLVVEMYGRGLERVLELAYDAGALSGELLDQLADDDLVGSLLLVHGLHPYSIEARVSRALDQLRPSLGSHGGDIELIGVTDDGVARLRMLGSCDGCASSVATLDVVVKEAIESVAPEVTRIEVVEESAAATTVVSGLISVESLSSRLRETEPAAAPHSGAAV